MKALLQTALLALTTCLFTGVQPVAAATIKLGGSEAMGCFMEIDGQIAKGDADDLRAMFEQVGYPTGYSPTGRRICLNSPGGILTEGLKIADLIAEWNFGTAVPDGAACQSACAVAFMAGRFNNPEAGGAFSIDRVIHPRAKLGFHAPSLLLGERAYSRKEVDTAYAIALNSMAGILRHRAEQYTSFPDSLFLALLGTPPYEMTLVETVGQAAQWQIGVVPVALPAGDLQQSLTYACRHADSGLLDYSLLEYGGNYPLDFSYEELTDDTLRAASSRDFRYEGSAQCELVIYANAWTNDTRMVESVGGASYTGGATDQDVSGIVYAYMLYPTEMRLDTLPVPRRGDDVRTSGFFRAAQNGDSGAALGGFKSCRLTNQQAQIINVSEFVNLRASPGLRAPVVGRVRLADAVQVPDTGRLLPLRDSPRAQTCLSICNGFAQNPSAFGVKEEAQGCIDENMLWYQVVDRSGNTGFISRKFLAD
jgi:hypothetical protein